MVLINMRILIVTQYFWPENFRINDLTLGLVERGHNIQVFTGVPNYPGGKFYDGYRALNKTADDFNGIVVHRSPLIPRGQGGGFRLTLNFLSFASFASILAPFYCRGKFDIIFVYEPSPITVGLPAIVLKKFKSIPIIFWMQDLWPESLTATGAVRSTVIIKIVELLVRFIYKASDQILVQSKAFIPSVLASGVNHKKVIYYPNSAETLYKSLDVELDTPERELLPDGFLVTFAGNIGAAQDFRTILDAAERLKSHKDIHFIILGDGRMSQWVKEQVTARELEKTVHLLGRYPIEAMPRYFALSDALLVTLKKEPIFALTIPSKVQSYLACAKPIIAAMDGEGSRVIEEAGAGLTCPAESPEDLANSVLKFYNMPKEDREEIGRKGRAYFENNFEREMLLDRLEDLIVKVASSR